MKPVIRHQSKLLVRQSYKPNRVIRIRPDGRLSFTFQSVRFGLKPKITMYECDTDRVQAL